MGVVSLGWAVVSEEDQFIDAGVRIFPAGLDNFNSPKEKHPNQDRRLARSMRRRIRRKAERKQTLASALQQLGWMPTDTEEQATWLEWDVYELRHRAIREQLSLPELGRVLYHLNQRRGFLSLRKTEAEGDKETQGLLGNISALEKAIKAAGARTLGSYLFQQREQDQFKTPKGKIARTTQLRNRSQKIQKTPHSRKMLYHEFDLIWKEQEKHHPGKLTSALRHGSEGPLPADKKYRVARPVKRRKEHGLHEQFGLEGIIFFQRRVYWPSDSIGKCELETDQFRAPVADRRFQEFRLLQEVNNLRITDRSSRESPTERPLHPEERAEAVSYLTGKDKPKLEALKKHLCKSKTLTEFPKEPASIIFNLEAAGRTTISGTPTDAKLKSSKNLGKQWEKLSEATKNEIVDALTLPAATDEDIRQALENIEELDAEQKERLLAVSLPSGYGHLSDVALKKLLPSMREGRLYMHKDFDKSALAAAGYPRPDERNRLTSALLPLFDELINPKSPDFDPHQGVINNPVVKRSLTELRKVVNAIIRKYGKPGRIHLEMARSLKMSPKQRKDYEKKTRAFEKERAEATKLLEECNIIPNRDALQLVRLWEEQQENCPYCEKSISRTQLLGGTGEVDIDHIYPFGRSADNSMMNKVVCHRQCNATKGDQTPREWLEKSNLEAYEAMLQRTKSLPHGKAKRFYANEIPKGFVNRDLNDTAWMAKAARQYLARLMPEAHLVQGTKGTHTALLRDHWQLHSLLRNDGIELKNRDDHRHHALDAILIALCDQPRIKALLSKHQFALNPKPAKEEGKKIYRLENTGSKIDAPWPGFRENVETSLNAIWVSHRPKRKVSGPLHKETNYGKNAKGDLIVRKRVQDLSKKEVSGICDSTIKAIVEQYIANHGGEVSSLKSVSDEEPLKMPSGIPIRRIRTAISYAHLTIRAGTPHETHVQSASTHHLAIFSKGEGKYHFEPVTLYEASRRLRCKEPIVQNHYEGMPPDAEFLFHLCSGDSMMANIDGQEQLFVFKTMATSTGQTWFAFHTDATENHKDPETGRSLLRSCMPGSFDKNFPNARKVNVLPMGEIR